MSGGAAILATTLVLAVMFLHGVITRLTVAVRPVPIAIAAHRRLRW